MARLFSTRYCTPTQAIGGFTAFFGTYEIDAENSVVIHRVEGHVLPESVGKVLLREFTFSGDVLILKPSPKRRVVWERIPRLENLGEPAGLANTSA
ncbi:MAG: lipocalin-like domain-containing protein [Blastocatellia bacterium]